MLSDNVYFADEVICNEPIDGRRRFNFRYFAIQGSFLVLWDLVDEEAMKGREIEADTEFKLATWIPLDNIVVMYGVRQIPLNREYFSETDIEEIRGYLGIS